MITKLHNIGIPKDVIMFISVWLTNRYFFVTVGDDSSDVHHSNVGIVQGTILGPILYAIFVGLLFDLAKITLFADDNYAISWNKTILTTYC